MVYHDEGAQCGSFQGAVTLAPAFVIWLEWMKRD